MDCVPRNRPLSDHPGLHRILEPATAAMCTICLSQNVSDLNDAARDDYKHSGPKSHILQSGQMRHIVPSMELPPEVQKLIELNTNINAHDTHTYNSGASKTTQTPKHSSCHSMPTRTPQTMYPGTFLYISLYIYTCTGSTLCPDAYTYIYVHIYYIYYIYMYIYIYIPQIHV